MRKGHSSPHFHSLRKKASLLPYKCGPCLMWPNGWMDQDATWYKGRPRPRRHCVRLRPSSPRKLRGNCASFRGAATPSNTTSLGPMFTSEPSGILIHPAVWLCPQKGGTAFPQFFGPSLFWPNNGMYQDTNWYGGRPQHRRHCVRWGPSSPSTKGEHPQFSANVRCG